MEVLVVSAHALQYSCASKSLFIVDHGIYQEALLIFICHKSFGLKFFNVTHFTSRCILQIHFIFELIMNIGVLRILPRQQNP